MGGRDRDVAVHDGYSQLGSCMVVHMAQSRAKNSCDGSV